MEMQGFKFGENGPDFGFVAESQMDIFNNRGLYTIFDTSSPDIGISKVYFDNFIDELMLVQPNL